MARLKPHLIMCNLHRSKLDANRPLTTAAEVWKNANIFLIFTAHIAPSRALFGASFCRSRF